MEHGLDAKVERVEVTAYHVPTATPEADGTFAWNDTTLVLARVWSQGAVGLGYSFADIATAHFIDAHLKQVIVGGDLLDIPELWSVMVRAIRNLGRPGVCSMAISAVDNALWDLKARTLHISVADLIGRARPEIPAYGSGGFTSYSDNQLRRQFSEWAEQGLTAVKMKVGADPAADIGRVRVAREAIGPKVELFVDANGAHDRQQALAQAAAFAGYGVTWFEEPVSSDDLEGLRFVREHAPAGMRIAAGEYGYDAVYFRRMLAAGAVDVLQADATRCAGITGFLAAASLSATFSTPFSAHTAPSLHAHACCAALGALNVEYFFDHYRIEQMFFDGATAPVKGMLRPDTSRPGFGLECKWADMEKYRIYGNPGK